MPEFSGVDLLNALEHEKLLHKQKIMIVTASAAGDRDLDQLKKIGVSECLRKPVDLERLVTKAQEIVMH